jgi:predicted house-cleaning noncanonical NTP pyrophosphatase (MazG superfamily)
LLLIKYDILTEKGIKNMKEFNKLVRDKIPQIIENNGEFAETRILTDEEYINELNIKLKEEVNEYLEDNNVEEIADIVEVLLAILKYKSISYEEFESIRNIKVEKRGAFDKRIFLERTYKKNEK